MKILIDECLPDELKDSVAAMGHECQTVRRAGYGPTGTAQRGQTGCFLILYSLMAHLSRIVAVNVPHHVTQRGNARQFILAGDDERLAGGAPLSR